MRPNIIVLGFGIIIASIIFMQPLYETVKNTSLNIKDINEEIKNAQIKSIALDGLQEAKLLKSAQYYAMFMSRINHDVNAMALKVQLEIIKSDSIVKHYVNEDYPGIRQIPFKLTFHNVVDGTEYVRILRQIQMWQQDFPLQIASIEFKSMQCQVIGGIYGR